MIANKGKIFVDKFICRYKGHPELADLVANERERRAAELSD